MKISKHAEHTEKVVGIRAEDIHKWIDGFFDAQSFSEFMVMGESPSYDPYDHRKYRHCLEALGDAYKEFEGKYSREQIKSVFECHLMDDYDGYLPCRMDFANGTFKEKYHEYDDRVSSERILSEAELSDYFKGKAYQHVRDKRGVGISGFQFNIVLPTIIAVGLFVASIFVVIIPAFHSNMMAGKKEMIRELTEAAESIVERYIAQEKSGLISLSEAQAKAAGEIGEIRYGSEMKDYFWITDMHPRMIMHAYRRDLVGADLSDYVDEENRSGKRLFVEFVKLVETDNEGYLEYHWQWKDDPGRMALKLSYVKGIPEWGWIIGTGIYIHDVEEEINSLTNKMLWALLLISGIVALIILYVVSQSRKIENDRLRAETGLLEAKERYRALVEASNEGYVLIVEGDNIYSNHTLQRMVGYSEEELVKDGVWELLLPASDLNNYGRRQIEKLLNGDSSATEFEAQVRTKGGSLVDVVMSPSRIFFSQKNGHVVTIRKIMGKNLAIDKGSLDEIRSYELPIGIHTEIENSKSVGHIIHVMNRLSLMIRDMTIYGVNSGAIREAICNIFEITMKKFIKLTLAEMSDEPVDFAFITLGSNARHEMTMFSDQDNAIIFRSGDKADNAEIRRYFLKLADRVSGLLDKAGYPYCPGGIMAYNPRWCMSLNEWKNRFTATTFEAEAESIFEVNTVFDIRFIYGDKGLVDDLQSHMISITRDNPEFFMHYARNCLLYQPPLGLFGKIRSENQSGLRSLNVKKCIHPIVNFARIYSLKHGIKLPGTLERLNELMSMGKISKETYGEISYAFDHLWYLRFYNQIICHADLRRVNDELDMERLSEVETQKLSDVLVKIGRLQTKLSYDFLGVSQI